MKLHQNNHTKPAALKYRTIDRELELKAINRILERRYEVLIELS